MDDQVPRVSRTSMTSRVRKRLRKLLKYGLVALGVLVAASVVYLGAAVVLAFVPVNEDFENAAEGIEIYLLSNGVHVDFVLPVRSPSIDWSELIPREQFVNVDSKSYRYLAFGWGDRAFYIETPAWSDVRVTTVAMAMLWPTSATMHVESIRQEPVVGELTRRVVLSRARYETLFEAIRESFRTTAKGQVIPIPGKSYGDTDNFYEGTGSYHAFNTCNMWTNRVLKETGVRHWHGNHSSPQMGCCHRWTSHLQSWPSSG